MTDVRPTLLADYTPPDYLIDTVSLDIALDPTRTAVTARLAVRRSPARADAASRPLVLDGELLQLESLSLDGSALPAAAYCADSKTLTIHEPPDRPFELQIATLIDPQSNTALQGLYRSRGIFCSQCEAEGFRRITYFLDRPDVLAKYTVRLTADINDAPVLLANGNLAERGSLPGGRHYAIWKDPHPKPCYLFAVVGGDLSRVTSTFTTMSDRTVELGIYVEHGKEDRAHWAMDSLKRAMAWDERRFGREYDLDVFNIVAVSDFNMGAMENKGLNIFNDRLVLASASTATDAAYEAIESVVAHEYFHNWTGNRITCRDWFQLCLKEGLTVYRDQEFSADERSRTVQRIADVRQLKAFQFPEDQGPLAHAVRPDAYVEINNFYTPTVYEKGAELVRMLHTILGPDGFRRGMDLYFERHDGDAATVEDFLRCFEDATGRSLTHFARWYSQAGTPELVCDFRYDKATASAELTITQALAPTPGQPKKEPLYIPLRAGLIGADGGDLPVNITGTPDLVDGLVILTDRVTSLKFDNVAGRPVPSLLRDFSAPVTLTFQQSDDDLVVLMTHDSDLFNRWQAANRFATRLIRNSIDHVDQSGAEKYARALAITLTNPALDDAYKAELLKLPTQPDIAREIGSSVDPDLVDRAHRAFAGEIAARLQPELEHLYVTAGSHAAYSPSAGDAGRRAVRNQALTLLTQLATAAAYNRLEKHYVDATNMTDTAHALMLLASTDIPARQTALDHFYDRWHHDHLVIDTWLAAQAQSALPSALDRVMSLTQHPVFAMAAPNKVRALIGAFAMSNMLQFNRPDGAGYDFVATKVIELDRLNPQVAARLLAAFRSYKALEPRRQESAKAALGRVAAVDDLSRDVREIVSRMLET